MPRITIVTPAKSSMLNGNWSTTARWRQFLRQANLDVTVEQSWNGEPCDLLIALHARKSAESIQRFSVQANPIIVVLTGTDVYRDIHEDASAQKSLDLATRLVALQAEAPQELNAEQRSKCVVIEQSAPRLSPLASRPATFDLLLVGHMRHEKDPLTALRAVSHLSDPEIRLRHIGAIDDPDIGPQAVAMAQADNRIELLGTKSHGETRQLIRQGRVLLLPSRIEGGANVLIEAVMSSVPVLASRISGSVGMLGQDYDGYFPLGDDRALANLVEKTVSSPNWLGHLTQQCLAQSHLFEPDRERNKLVDLVHQLLPE